MDDDGALIEYLDEVAKHTPLSDEEESELFRVFSEGQLAERRLIEGRLSLVVTLAREHVSSGMPLFHLIQEGNVGLMRAVREFGKSPSGSFTKYATEMIEGQIEWGIAEHKRNK